MSAPELWHLPDIPNAGYATSKEKYLSDTVMTFMRDTERNRVLLLSIVLDGRERWRTVAGKVLPSWADDDLLDAVFHYFELQACRPAMQRRLLEAKNNPEVWRLLMREATPDIEADRERARLVAKWLT